MLGSAPSVTPKPAAMPPAAPPAQPGAGSAGGPSFAHFLNDRPDPQPAHVDPVPNAPDTAKESSAAANAAQARRKEGNAAPKPATPAQSRAPEAAATPKPAGDAKACDEGSEPADAAAGTDDDAQTSGLNEFTQLIGLAVPTPQPAQAAAAGAAATADADTGAGRAIRSAHAGRTGRGAGEARDEAAGGEAPARDPGTATPNERRPADAAARANDAPRAKGIELAADKAAAARSARSDALQAGALSPAAAVGAAPRAAAAPDALPNSFAAVLAQAQPASAAVPGVAPASARVNAALHSQAFAPELGARVSLLAVNGVQQAELQLNPADMGPVAVQIVVDGAQAQVSFHAAQAETRQALQQSLPDLAAALQSQGLTLAGGGVFQQASQDAKDGQPQAGSGDDRGSRTAGGSAGGVEGAAAAAPPARRSVGLLDTFA